MPKLSYKTLSLVHQSLDLAIDKLDREHYIVLSHTPPETSTKDIEVFIKLINEIKRKKTELSAAKTEVSDCYCDIKELENGTPSSPISINRR